MILLDGTTNISTSTLKTGKGKGEIHVVVKGPFTTFPLLLSSQKKIVPDK